LHNEYPLNNDLARQPLRYQHGRLIGGALDQVPRAIVRSGRTPDTRVMYPLRLQVDGHQSKGTPASDFDKTTTEIFTDFIPLHRQEHWTLAAVVPSQAVVRFYNSLQDSTRSPSVERVFNGIFHHFLPLDSVLHLQVL
jgi:hypothetical protein